MFLSSGLLFTAIKTQAEENFHMGAILLFYILKIVLNKSVTLFQGSLLYIISKSQISQPTSVYRYCYGYYEIKSKIFGWLQTVPR
jgi:hypothetical protein